MSLGVVQPLLCYTSDKHSQKGVINVELSDHQLICCTRKSREAKVQNT